MKWIEKTNLRFEAKNYMFTFAIITPEFNDDLNEICITIGKRIKHELSLRRSEVFKLRRASFTLRIIRKVCGSDWNRKRK